MLGGHVKEYSTLREVGLIINAQPISLDQNQFYLSFHISTATCTNRTRFCPKHELFYKVFLSQVHTRRLIRDKIFKGSVEKLRIQVTNGKK